MASNQYSIIRPELLDQVAPFLVALAASLAAVLWSIRIMLRLRRPAVRWPAALGMRGTSELEFALALPIFLVSVLTTVQVALMVNANLIVDYAAFCAARSAAVWLPQEVGAERPHAIAPPGTDGSEKRERIHRAAMWGVLPISPRMSRFRFGLSMPSPPEQIDGAALSRLASAADATIGARLDPVRLGAAVVDKFLYAYWFTEVELHDGSGRPATTFEPEGTVTARVTHKFEMAVPFAGPFLGYALGDRYVPRIGGFYVPITAAYTLMMASS